jgi:hypothetical protein
MHRLSVTLSSRVALMALRAPISRAMHQTDETHVMTEVTSPLKQVPKQALRPKYETDLALLCSNEAIQNSRVFLHAFYCLRPKPALVAASLAVLSDEEILSGPRRENLQALFAMAVDILSNADCDDARTLNAVQVRAPNSGNLADADQTLLPFLRDVLARHTFTNYSQDIIALLAGSMDQSDRIFTVDFAVMSLVPDLPMQ